MILTPSINSSVSYTGIYKIKDFKSKKNFDIQKFLTDNIYVHRISNPFTEGNDSYIYAITTDDIAGEAMFENQLEKKFLSYQKALPFAQIADKSIIDKLFEISRKITGKENWKS
jgi:hypothetical protein